MKKNHSVAYPGTEYIAGFYRKGMERDAETLRLIVKHRMSVWHDCQQWGARHGINGHEEKHRSLHTAVRRAALSSTKGGRGMNLPDPGNAPPWHGVRVSGFLIATPRNGRLRHYVRYPSSIAAKIRCFISGHEVVRRLYGVRVRPIGQENLPAFIGIECARCSDRFAILEDAP